MPDKPRKLRIFTGSGSLIALAIAAVMVLGIVGPSSTVLQFRWIPAAPQHAAVAAGSAAGLVAGLVVAGR
jgi:hypothetical protein